MPMPSSLRLPPGGRTSLRGGSKKSVLVREGGAHTGIHAGSRTPNLKKPVLKKPVVKKPPANNALKAAAAGKKHPPKPKQAGAKLGRPKKSTLIAGEKRPSVRRPRPPSKPQAKSIAKPHGHAGAHPGSGALALAHKKQLKKSALPTRPKKSVLVREAAPKRPHAPPTLTGARSSAKGPAHSFASGGQSKLAKVKRRPTTPGSLKRGRGIGKRIKLPQRGALHAT